MYNADGLHPNARGNLVIATQAGIALELVSPPSLIAGPTATITAGGLATGVAQGITSIRATFGAISASTTLTVTPPALSAGGSIEVRAAQIEAAGRTHQLAVALLQARRAARTDLHGAHHRRGLPGGRFSRRPALPLPAILLIHRLHSRTVWMQATRAATPASRPW